jgi:DNA polymerase III sliding clamp (beta) subunit (PCNA family)
MRCNDKYNVRLAEEFIEIDYKNPEFRIGFNAGKLILLLSGIDGERCVLHFSGNLRPVVITPAPEDKGITQLIMPIYIDG